jgi:glycyl-tRNA synthetase beta subunit
LKLRPLSAQLFRGTDGRTDMTKPTVAFRNLTHPIRSNLCLVLTKHKLPTTKLGNFAEPRQLAVAVKQANCKQSNTAIAIACEPRLVEK